MNTCNLSENGFSIVFDKVKQYNEANVLSNDNFLKPEEIITSEEIRTLGQICRELNDNSQSSIIYQTFFDIN